MSVWAGDVSAQALPKEPPAQAGDSAPTGDEQFPFEGQLSRKFRINDANPEASVPDLKVANENPLEFGYFLQDLLLRAEEARKAKDYPAVVRYYRAVAKGAPERAKGWGKLCEAYQLVNDRVKALNAC